MLFTEYNSVESKHNKTNTLSIHECAKIATSWSAGRRELTGENLIHNMWVTYWPLTATHRLWILATKTEEYWEKRWQTQQSWRRLTRASQCTQAQRDADERIAPSVLTSWSRLLSSSAISSLAWSVRRFFSSASASSLLMASASCSCNSSSPAVDGRAASSSGFKSESATIDKPALLMLWSSHSETSACCGRSSATQTAVSQRQASLEG